MKDILDKHFDAILVFLSFLASVVIFLIKPELIVLQLAIQMGGGLIGLARGLSRSAAPTNQQTINTDKVENVENTNNPETPGEIMPVFHQNKE